jgi:uridine kinase
MARLVIGIAGGSGSGKTTVVRRMVDRFGAAGAAVLEHDRYYRDRPGLTEERRAALNYDHPQALDTPLLVAHVRALKAGTAIRAPVYDFSRHARLAAADTIEPRPVVIVEGILVLADEALRALFDVKVFVDTDADLRFIRRLNRDVGERGRTVESVIHQYLATVRPMHDEFVEPSRRYADVIVPAGGHDDAVIDRLLATIAAR